MADEPVEGAEAEREAEAPARERFRKRRIAKWFFGAIAALALLIVGAVLLLNSPVGKRFVADQIAKVAPASGLRIEIGRIEGDLYGEAVLHDVVLSDPKGPFLTVPVAEIDWRPLAWLTSGLDVRKLVARRGTLLRLPELEPGDPDAPLLPNFDIRVDRLELIDFTIAPGVAGDTAQRVNLLANVDIRDGRAYVRTRARLGERDRVFVLLDAEPEADRFDLSVDYAAPQGGVVSGLVGAEAGYRAIVTGEGTWTNWRGALLVRREDERFAAFRLTNRAGRYGIVGQVHPDDVLTGLPADALGQTVSLAAFGTLEESVLEGEVALRGRAVRAEAEGIIDLAENAVDALQIDARLTDPRLFGPDLVLEGARITADIEGGFRDLAIDHRLQVARLVSGTTEIREIVQEGRATYDGSRWTLPLDAQVARIETGNAYADPRLVNGRISGPLVLAGDRLTAENLRVTFPGLNANLALQGNLARGAYAISGPVSVEGLQLENLGAVSGTARINYRMASGAPWSLDAQFDGRIPRVTNDTLANLAGPAIAFRGGVQLGSSGPIVFRNVTIGAQKLRLTLDGRVADGTTSIAGRGTHTDYGSFTVEANLTGRGPEAVLVFANPLPAAGLTDVRVAISPSKDGFLIDTEGGSMLGPFAGDLELFAPAGGPTRIAINSLTVSQTSVTGDLILGDSGVNGTLALSGGGLDGTIALMPRGGGQGFAIDATARNARFGGETPLTIASGDIDATGLLVDGNSTIEGSIRAQGVGYGSLFIGRLAAQAELVNGRGEVTAALAGRRGSGFNLQLTAGIAPERVIFAARGEFAGRRIAMPRRGVAIKQADGGWSLQPTQLSYGNGALIAAGEFGGGETALELKLARMPLSLVDVAIADMGLGGTISGVIDYRDAGGPPTGTARVKVDNLTRSGLVLTSRPVDLALVARLSANELETRAVIRDEGNRLGRMQARISNLPRGGALFERLQSGRLFAQLRYNGPADALWRLAAIDTFDLTGPLRAAANVTGTLADPRVRGTVASDSLRIRSGLSGTDVRDVSARGTFSGSRLRLTRFAGTTPNGGSVVGSGTVDLANMGGGRGPQLDLRMAARNAALLNANGLKATVTGPMRIVSDGRGGTIAGRLLVDRASWRLGTAAADTRLPRIPTREINLPLDVAPQREASGAWRYLIDARAVSRIDVDGMGLDSEWSADVILRGTTENPRIGGEAQLVRGSYSFAGTRFELEEGQIDFDANVPINPRLDIEAVSERDGFEVTVNIHGTATEPEISFASVPALPEEEILARLLFGGSITELSATDALQLGAALASLRGGGGMDPINQLRTAIGLDRLRIVGPDPALDRGTAVALGKNFGRRFYAEIITDGRGYSATEVEFRVTSWLSLLASISTIGRESAVAEISRDY